MLFSGSAWLVATPLPWRRSPLLARLPPPPVWSASAPFLSVFNNIMINLNVDNVIIMMVSKVVTIAADLSKEEVPAQIVKEAVEKLGGRIWIHLEPTRNHISICRCGQFGCKKWFLLRTWCAGEFCRHSDVWLRWDFGRCRLWQSKYRGLCHQPQVFMHHSPVYWLVQTPKPPIANWMNVSNLFGAS